VELIFPFFSSTVRSGNGSFLFASVNGMFDRLVGGCDHAPQDKAGPSDSESLPRDVEHVGVQVGPSGIESMAWRERLPATSPAKSRRSGWSSALSVLIPISAHHLCTDPPLSTRITTYLHADLSTLKWSAMRSNIASRSLTYSMRRGI